MKHLGKNWERNGGTDDKDHIPSNGPEIWFEVDPHSFDIEFEFINGE